MNLNEFNKVDSLRVKETGEIMSHEEFYTNVVNGIGLGTLVGLLPATKEKIQECLKKDENLNNIPLADWDECAKHMKFYIGRIGVKSISLGQSVCILKQTARMYAREKVSIKCFYENGDSITTRINGTFEEAQAYFVGKVFNIGLVDDDLQKCIKIELVKWN